MDQLADFLEEVKRQGITRGQLRGLLHILIGRRITKEDGTSVSEGLTWREAAAQLKRTRWDTEAVKELGLNPADLPVRDRERFWYASIALAGVDTAEATASGDRVARALGALGYVIGPAPGQKKKR